MDKKNKRLRYWALLTIDRYPGGRGIKLSDLYDRRPYYFDVDFSTFDNYIHDLYKQKLLDTGDNGKYQLTDKGKDSLSGYLKNSSIFEIYSISKFVPEYAIFYRLKVMESFIGSLFFTFMWAMILVGIGYLGVQSYWVLFPISTLFLLSLAVLFASGIIVSMNFLFGVMGSISKSFKNFLFKLMEKYSSVVFTIVIVVSIVLVLILGGIIFGYSIREIAWQILILFIGYVLVKAPKIKACIEKKISKK